MAGALHDQSYSCFSRKRDSTLHVLNSLSRDHEARVAVYVAWSVASWKTSNIVIVGGHEVECVECGIYPLLLDEGTRHIVVLRH
jgi:hypothetical protein